MTSCRNNYPDGKRMTIGATDICALGTKDTPKAFPISPHLGTKDSSFDLTRMEIMHNHGACSNLLKFTVTMAQCQINCDVYLALLDEYIHETHCLEQKDADVACAVAANLERHQIRKGQKLKQSTELVIKWNHSQQYATYSHFHFPRKKMHHL